MIALHYVLSKTNCFVRKLSLVSFCSGISSQSESIRTDVGDFEQSVYNVLDEMDVSSFLIYKTAGDDGPEIRGGPVDALIVKATEVSKNGEFSCLK